MNLTVGDFVYNNQYRILRLLGEGGFGKVFLADDIKFDKYVALKQFCTSELPPKDLKEAMRLFECEAAILAQLNYSGIPIIYKFFPHQDDFFIVMEVIVGLTLEEHAKQQRGFLPVKEVLDYAIEVCSILTHLHNQNPPIIFRDLNPKNIMRDRKERVYLIDFGIARRYKKGKPGDTTNLGTHGFAAPEQYEQYKEKAQTDARTDIFGLGSTMHCLITGVDPSAKPFHFCQLSVTQPVPNELEGYLRTMVAMERKERPEEAAIVKANLERIRQAHFTRHQYKTF